MKKMFLSALSLALLVCTFGAQAVDPSLTTVSDEGRGQTQEASTRHDSDFDSDDFEDSQAPSSSHETTTPAQQTEGEESTGSASCCSLLNRKVMIVLGSSAAVGATAAGLTHLYNVKYNKNVNKLKAALIAGGVTAVGTTAYFYFSR